MMDIILTDIIHTAFAILSVLLAGLVPYAVMWLAKRLKIQVKAEQQNRIMGAVADGVALAEQVAQRRAKGGVPVSSDDKLELATQHALAEIAGAGLSVATDVVVDKIEATLGRLKIAQTFPASPGPVDPAASPNG